MGLELTTGRIPPRASTEESRAAAVHVADRIASEHPHDLDDVMPRLAGRQTATQPEARDGLLTLLDALGLLPDGRRP